MYFVSGEITLLSLNRFYQSYSKKTNYNTGIMF